MEKAGVCDQRHFWYMVNKCRGKNISTQTNPIRKTDGTYATDIVEIRKLWSEYYKKLYKPWEDSEFDCNFKDYIEREVDNLESELNNLCRRPLEDEIDVKEVIKVSSVDCGARVSATSGFALRCPDGAISGQKRVFLGSFGGFSAPRQAGRPGEPRSDQSEAEFGAGLAFIYIHNRENRGGPLLVKKGGFLGGGGFDKQDGKGAKQKGGPSELPLYIYIHNREMGGGTEGCHFWSKRGSLVLLWCLERHLGSHPTPCSSNVRISVHSISLSFLASLSFLGSFPCTVLICRVKLRLYGNDWSHSWH